MKIFVLEKSARAWFSVAIGVVVALACVASMGWKLAGVVAVAVIAATVVFIVLSFIRDLLLETHTGWKRLTIVASLASVVIAPLVYVYLASDVRSEIVIMLALAAPPAVGVAVYYGRRLTQWVRAGFA